MKKFLSLFPQQSFPTPDDVLRLKDNDFKRAGVSSQKMSYLRDLAQKFNEKYINPRMFKTMSDEEIREHLVAVKGIGRWTADMFLIFALNRPNILPIGDLGIQNGFKIAFKLRARPNEKKMYALAKPYYGEWTKLSLYLWECADAKSSFRKS
jgi:DNA-3-methyladenine glycosylase II